MTKKAKNLQKKLLDIDYNKALNHSLVSLYIILFDFA